MFLRNSIVFALLFGLAYCGNMTFSEKQSYCKLESSDLQTCESCIGKGTDCFWCGGKTKECLPFEWYYPGCNIKDVKYNVCWVNTSAAAIVIAICAGIIVVILISCACWCYCRCKRLNRIHKKAKAAKWNTKQSQLRREMDERHSVRSKERQAELDTYRQKYGIPSKEEQAKGKV